MIMTTEMTGPLEERANRYRKQRIEELRELYDKAEVIRKELGLSGAGEVVWQGDVDDDCKVVVTADGLGGGLLEYVEGNFPVDYMNNGSREFDDERDALDAANRLLSFYNGVWDSDEEGEAMKERDADKEWSDLVAEIFNTGCP